jgi:hypothetical protein
MTGLLVLSADPGVSLGQRPGNTSITAYEPRQRQRRLWKAGRARLAPFDQDDAAELL